MSTILIVDDLEPNRYLLHAMLTGSGHAVMEASNGAQALELAHRSELDLIISDVLMPQMDGFALCRACKHDEKLRTIPFVFYTAAYTDPRDQTLGLQLGAARFIVKPIEGKVFLNIVGEVLATYAAGKLAAANPPPPLEAEEDTVFYRLYNDALIRRLEEQMIELERLNQNLTESEARFRRLAENAQDLIYRYEFVPQQGFTYVSPSAVQMTGYTPEDHYADPDLGFKLVHPDDRPLLETTLRDERHPRQSLTLRWVRKDGQVIWIEQHKVSIFDQAGSLIAIEVIARDVTVRKQREHEMEVIIAISAALRVAQTRAEMLPTILDQVLALLHVDAALLALRSPATEDMLVELGRGAWESLHGTRLQEETGASLRAQSSISDEHRSLRLDLDGHLPWMASVPLMVRGQRTGLLAIGRALPLNDYDLRLLTAIADMAANAIHRAALHEETQRRFAQLQALQTIDHAITAGIDLRDVLRTILEQSVSQLGAAAAGILLVEPYNMRFAYAAGYGFHSEHYEQSKLALNEGRAGQAFSERRVITVNDITNCTPTFVRLDLLGHEGFAAYAVAPLIAKDQVKGVLEVFHRMPFQHSAEWVNFIEALGQHAAIAIDNAQLFKKLQQSNRELSLAYDSTIEGWSHALDLRDHETEGHSLRVTEMTVRLARAAGMSAAQLAHVRRGALLHDIGKMGIPDAILLKPTALSNAEWEIMRKHPVYAYELLRPIAYLRPALDIPYCHHEKWDGSGYPRGLKGEEIPLAARLFAVVDVWDALSSDRPYRKGWAASAVLAYLDAQAGHHFDPEAVALFLKVLQG